MRSEVEATQRSLESKRSLLLEATGEGAAPAPTTVGGGDLDAKECGVCMDAENTHALVPCGHKAACARCAQGLTLCPFCRAPVQASLRIFEIA
mmetsp:Transcript_13304/g.43815  ORF Transcript_13304/g.43815 Transcript_13304/m.43815 type:complete len:93 (+) Transcript_13304:168-446(+)